MLEPSKPGKTKNITVPVCTWESSAANKNNTCVKCVGNDDVYIYIYIAHEEVACLNPSLAKRTKMAAPACTWEISSAILKKTSSKSIYVVGVLHVQIYAKQVYIYTHTHISLHYITYITYVTYIHTIPYRTIPYIT